MSAECNKILFFVPIIQHIYNHYIMKQIILRNGLIAAAIMIGIPLIGWLFMDEEALMDFKTGEIIGYGTMVVSMIFVFLGIKQYREKENKGQLSFIEGLKLGLMITVFPALAFALYNYVYVEILEPDFTEVYYAYQIDELKVQLSSEAFEMEKVKMEEQKEMFMNPWISTTVMFFTVFIIGLIASILSAFVLQRKQVQLSNS